MSKKQALFGVGGRRGRLRRGSGQYKVSRWFEGLAEGERVLPFSDRARARIFLEALCEDPANHAVLESWATDSSMRTERAGRRSRLSDLAERLVRGELRIVSTPAVVTEAPFRVRHEAAAAVEPEPIPPEIEWVAFQVVDHDTCDPVPDVELEVTLPDGTVEAATTNADGKVEFRGIQPGACSVTSPIEGAIYDKSLPFIEIGVRAPTITSTGEGEDNPEAQEEEVEGPFKVVIILDHHLARGETIDDIAEAHGLTWEELAMFNWETTDRAEVDEILAEPERETEPAEEEQPEEQPLRYHLEGDDDTAPEEEREVSEELPNLALPNRSLLVPKQWTEGGLGTGGLHTIRVRGPGERRAFISLVLYDDWWQSRLAGKPYTIEGPGGPLFEGTTDESGFLEHGLVEMGYYLITVDEVRPVGFKELVEDPELPPPPDFPAFIDPFGHEGVDFSDMPDLEADGEEEDEPTDEEEAASEEEGESKDDAPVVSITFTVPAVWEEDRRYPQRVPGAAPDGW